MVSRLLISIGIAATLVTGCNSTGQSARGLADSEAPSAMSEPAVNVSSVEPADSSGEPAASSAQPTASEESPRPEPTPSVVSDQPSPQAKLSLAGGRFINGCKIAPNTQCSGADLRSQDLTAVRLNGANLSYANLSNSDLSDADLTNANLTGADLTGSNFTNAVMDGAKLDKATLCQTRIFGKTDSSGCPPSPKPTRRPSNCKDATVGAGWANRGTDQVVGSLTLAPYPTVLQGLRPADGSSLSISQFMPLYAVLGNTFGGGTNYFGLPSAVGGWAGLSGTDAGTATCLTWAVASSGIFPSRENPPQLLPNEVIFMAMPEQYLAQWRSAGLVDTGLGSKVGPGITALAGPDSGYDDFSTPVGELRLFRGNSIPRSFHRADGSVVNEYEYPGLADSLGAEYTVDGEARVRLPKISAPDGFTWGVAVQGPFPERS